MYEMSQAQGWLTHSGKGREIWWKEYLALLPVTLGAGNKTGDLVEWVKDSFEHRRGALKLKPLWSAFVFGRDVKTAYDALDQFAVWHALQEHETEGCDLSDARRHPYAMGVAQRALEIFNAELGYDPEESFSENILRLDFRKLQVFHSLKEAILSLFRNPANQTTDGRVEMLKVMGHLGFTRLEIFLGVVRELKAWPVDDRPQTADDRKAVR